MNDMSHNEQLVKIAIDKNEDIDMLKATGDIKKFDYINIEEFRETKNILILGVANVHSVITILEECNNTSQIIILENETKYITAIKEQIQGIEKNIKIYQCNLENLRLNYEYIDKYLQQNEISTLKDYYELENKIKLQSKEQPLIKNEWADIIYINLFNRYEKKIGTRILNQLNDVLKTHGKILINVVLADERLRKNIGSIYNSVEIKNIPLESQVLEVFEGSGYLGISYSWKASLPINIVRQVELRPYLIRAFKGIQSICKEKGHAVFYSGPWKEVVDDDGHTLKRGERAAVCEKTFKNLTGDYYKGQVIGIEPYYTISEEEAQVFDCTIRPEREPKVTKGIKKVDIKKVDDIDEIRCC